MEVDADLKHQEEILLRDFRLMNSKGREFVAGYAASMKMKFPAKQGNIIPLSDHRKEKFA